MLKMFSFQLKRNRLYPGPVLPYATWWSIYISLIFPFPEGAHLPEEPGGRDAAAGRGRARTIRSESGRLIFRNHRKRNSAFPEPAEGNFRNFLKTNRFFYCHSGTPKFEVMGANIAQWLAYLLLDLAVLGSIPSVVDFFQRIICCCFWGWSMALLWGKLTVAWKYWSNPCSTCYWHASRAKKVWSSSTSKCINLSF